MQRTKALTVKATKKEALIHTTPRARAEQPSGKGGTHSQDNCSSTHHPQAQPTNWYQYHTYYSMMLDVEATVDSASVKVEKAQTPKEGESSQLTIETPSTAELESHCQQDEVSENRDDPSVTANSKEKRKEATDSKDDKSVGFGSVYIREYERVIDSTSIYMGLALGWNFNQSEPMPVSDESPKAKDNTPAHGGDESRMKRTNGSDRYGMLLRYGYQRKELNKATDEAAKFFKQRQREAARSLVVADERKKNAANGNKRKPLFGSMFRR